MKTAVILFVFIICYIVTPNAQISNDYSPKIHGTIRAKYEYEPPIDKGRFEIRNARLSVEGKVIPIVRYKAEIDLSDEGKIKMLDVFAAYRLPLKKGLTSISFLGRYDYISNHSKGNKDTEGKLKIDDPERHRLTGGLTLSLGASGQKCLSMSHCFTYGLNLPRLSSGYCHIIIPYLLIMVGWPREIGRIDGDMDSFFL
ncbi:MAG: hypothetical protein K2H60_05100 [Muribaculaceae bacterium]|nr:hypothetical protein [Muribaculaceae bacterium]